MKLSLITIAFLLLFQNSSSIINFDNPKYHLVRKELSKGKIKHKFFFTNLSKSPIRILDVKTSCTCTAPSYSAAAVLPGKKGFVELSTTEEQLRVAMNVNAVVKIDSKQRQFYKIELFYD